MPPPGGILSKPLRRSTRNAITIQQKCQPSKRHHHHDAHRRIKLNAVTASGAQCYPRLACALNGSNLMQVHYYARSAPALGLHPKINFLFCMQNHASLDASAYMKVTVPLITPVIFFNFIMQTTQAFQEFTGPYVITGGGPTYSTYLFSLYIYDTAFKYFDMGYGAALAWILFLVVAVFAAIAALHRDGDHRGDNSR
jgi:hypothetical protein